MVRLLLCDVEHLRSCSVGQVSFAVPVCGKIVCLAGFSANTWGAVVYVCDVQTKLELVRQVVSDQVVVVTC